MYRYFLAKNEHLPNVPSRLHESHIHGHWHAIHLDAHGDAGKGWSLVVLHDPGTPPHKDWIAFPKVVDAKTPIKARLDHELLADLGLTGDETTLEAADKLGAIFPPFEHP